MVFLIGLALTLFVASVFATSADKEQCRNHPVQVQGTGPIALVGLMNQWGQKYSDFRRGFGYDVQVTYNDSASYKKLPLSKQQRVWYTTTHVYNTNTSQPSGWFFFPYLIRALVVIFNLQNVTQLNITVEALADIYSGNITVWDDERIQKYNPGVDIPSEKIRRVARAEEAETSTGLFTQFLEYVSATWRLKYGSYFGPGFTNNGTCCNSTSWPPNVIEFFARDVVGVVGIVSSVMNTIGYITVPSITKYSESLTIATLLSNDGSQMIAPTRTAQQQVMYNYLKDNPRNQSERDFDGSIVITKDVVSSNGAYPMTSVTYMNISATTDDPNVDCCAAMELLGFIDWMLDNSTASYLLNQSYIPILPQLAARIRHRMLKNVTCNGRYVYDDYHSSLLPPVTPFQQTWLIAFLVIGGAFLLVTIVYAYMYNQRRKRADVNQWLIPNARIRFATGNSQKHKFGKLSSHASIFRHLTGSKADDKDAGIINDAASINSDLSVSKPETRPSSDISGSRTLVSSAENGTTEGAAIEQLKDLFVTGELDGNPVSLTKLNLVRWPPINWSSKAKRLMTDLKSCSIHKNLATIMGVVCTVDGRQYVVTEHCPKGTLRYVLGTCRYRLTDTIRRFLCLDVARAFVYLHDRSLASGRLNSLTCYLDSSWTVKVAEWQNAALHFGESANGRGHQTRAMLGVAYDPEELLDEESLIRLLYVDASILDPPKEQAESRTNEGILVSALKHADEYSFGYLLAEIFSGHLPYNVEAEMDDFSYADFFREKFQKADTLRAPALTQQTPKVVLQLIEQCLKPEPKMRPRFSRIYKLLNEMRVDSNAKRGSTFGGGKGIVDVMMDAMDLYAHTMEEKVEERTTELKMLTKRMRDLLNEVLPPVVAEKLFTGQTVPPEFFECVSVYFSDVVGFTAISAQSTPFQVMSLLNDLWLLFDSVIDKFDVYKVDTIGDAYMVCSGLPNRNGILHCKNICQLSLALLEKCGQFEIPHLPSQQLRIRIGVNSGPVTAGVVGSKMPQYCVFGDTVNTAARMESSSVPNKIQISHNAYELLRTHFPNDFLTQYRGEIEIKGKGTMKTYWLLNATGSGMLRRSAGD